MKVVKKISKLTTVLMMLLTSTLVNDLQAQINFARPFQDCNVEGSITLYDLKERKWMTSDILDSNNPTLPASTFKIINTLIVLETDMFSGIEQIIKWPGVTDTVKYGYRPDIYHDISIKDAFKQSAGWAYIEMAKQIGKVKYKTYLKACDYGNVDLSIKDDDFWNFGNFKISPINQIEILRGVYEESLPFKKSSFAALKDLMIDKKTDEYTLRAKTGWTRGSIKEIGWWVGYVERKDNVYFFATRLVKDKKDSNKDFGNCRKKITLEILKALKII